MAIRYNAARVKDCINEYTANNYNKRFSSVGPTVYTHPYMGW
jgi:predicted sugar kinase